MSLTDSTDTVSVGVCVLGICAMKSSSVIVSSALAWVGVDMVWGAGTIIAEVKTTGIYAPPLLLELVLVYTNPKLLDMLLTHHASLILMRLITPDVDHIGIPLIVPILDE